jgi:hypothetical protein
MRRRRRRRGAAVQERLAKSEAAGESKKSREHKIIKKKCGKRFGAFRSVTGEGVKQVDFCCGVVLYSS